MHPRDPIDAKETPKSVQKAPKKRTRGAQERPKGAQEAPRPFQNEALEPSKASFLKTFWQPFFDEQIDEILVQCLLIFDFSNL